MAPSSRPGGRRRRAPHHVGGDRDRPTPVGGGERPQRGPGRPPGVQRPGPAHVRLRQRRQRDRRVRTRELPAHRLRGHPRTRRAGLPHRGGQRVLLPRRHQRAVAVPGDVVQLRLRRAPAGGVDDHDAGRQERLPRRPRTRRSLQAAPDPLRPDAREGARQGSDHGALPEHGVLREQLVRHPGRRRDLLRQDGRRADLRRGGVPRRPRAVTVGFRPDQRARAQPGPLAPGDRRPRHPERLRREPRPDHRRPGPDPRGRVHDPVAHQVGPDPGDGAHVLHRGVARLPAQQVGHPGRRLPGALQPAVPWWSAHPHHAGSGRPAGRRGRPPGPTARHAGPFRRRPGVARRPVRGHPCDGRGSGVPGQRARGEHGAQPAPDGLQHQVLHPGGRRAGGRTGGRHHRRASRLPTAQRGRPGRAVLRDQRRCRGLHRRPPSDHGELDQLRFRPALADRRTQPCGRHHLPPGRIGVPVRRPARERTPPHRAVRQFRDGRQRDDRARHGVGHPVRLERRIAQGPLLRRVHRPGRRIAHVHPLRRRHTRARRGRRP